MAGTLWREARLCRYSVPATVVCADTGGLKAVEKPSTLKFNYESNHVIPFVCASRDKPYFSLFL